MGALAAGRRAPAGLGGALLGLLVLLSCCQLAAAQNYTALREGVWLPPQCKIDNVTEAKEYDGLVEKLPQIKGTRAEQQLQLLSAGSRSKLNNLTGNAAEWLKNRTDIELEELFENVRAENFRRMMAMASISTQLRSAFTSSNVLRSLELLQTEDLERLASLPLFEERYQRLTNVTFLELMRKLYDFGMTQVTQRTCIMTAANTSSISRLPNADQYPSASETSTTSFAAIKSDPSAVTQYSILSGRRRSSSHRRSLLEIFADTASSWLHLDHEEAAAAVVREVTAGPGSAPGQMRKMLYTPQSVEGTTAAPSERTVAPIVTTFLDSLTPITGEDGEKTYQNPDPNQDPTALLSSAGGIPGLSTQPGFLDSRVVSRGCSENLGLFRVRTGSTAGTASATGARASGSTGGSRTGSGSTSGTTAPSVTQLTKPVNSLGPVSPANCTAQGLVSNGTACVPCPTGAVLDGAACVCGNGTSWSAAVNACITSTAIPTTLTPCSAGNGTTTNGTACGGSSSNQPLVNSTVIATPTTLTPNATATPLPSAGVVNVSLIDPAAGVLNGTVVAPEVLAPVALNATSLPAGIAPAGILPAAGSGNDSVVTPQVLDPSVPLPAPAANASAPVPPAIAAPEVLPTPAPLADPANTSKVLPASGNVLPAQEPAVADPSPSPAHEGIAVIGNTVLPAASVIDPSTLGVSPSPAVTDPAAVVPSPTPTEITNGAAAGALIDPAAQPVASPAVAANVAVVNPATVLTPTDAAVPPPTAVPSPAVVAPLPQPLVQPVVEQPVAPIPVVPTPVPEVPVVPVTPVLQPVAVEAPAPPVTCVGQWVETGVCNAPCEKAGTKTSTYQIITPAANGGATCEAVSGAIREVPCTSTEVCPKALPVNCVGSWADTAPCDAKCESAGNSVQTYTVITPAADGGAQCEAASGQTRQVPCSNPAACPKPPVNCVGSWAESGTCNAACESTGTKTSVFTVTTPEANGGAPCEAVSGQTREVPCSNPTPCARSQIAPVTVPEVPPTAPVTPRPVVVTPTVVEPAAAVVTPAAVTPTVEQVATGGVLPP